MEKEPAGTGSRYRARGGGAEGTPPAGTSTAMGVPGGHRGGMGRARARGPALGVPVGVPGDVLAWSWRCLPGPWGPGGVVQALALPWGSRRGHRRVQG